jgi:hypothetical protein
MRPVLVLWRGDLGSDAPPIAARKSGILSPIDGPHRIEVEANRHSAAPVRRAL